MQSLFESHFAHCGRVLAFDMMHFDARVSNQHFRVITDHGQYIFKQLVNPDALYGGDGMGRLELVTRAGRELNQAHLPVECVVPTHTGRLLVVDGDRVFRAYHFIEGRAFNGSETDIQVAAHALRSLHDAGARSLEPTLLAQMESFSTPYAFSETRPKLHEIVQFLRAEGAFGQDAERHIELLRGELAMLEKVDLTAAERCLVHLDFHPDNAIYANDGLYIIDLDNLMLGNRYKCLAFSVMRFAREMDLGRAIGLWRSAYGFADDSKLVSFMAHIEIEKILRIGLRVMQTGSYRQFLRNVETRHMVNLRALSSLRSTGLGP